jgi:hypothetical protein
MPLHGLSFELTNLSNCDGSWDFSPAQQASPLLPAWALDGHLLTGFHLGHDHPVQNIKSVSSGDASQLLKALYPSLSWTEVVRLLSKPEVEKFFEASHLMQTYGFSWDLHWQKISGLLLTWPMEVQNFIAEKDLKPFDLVVLLSLPTETQIRLLQKLISIQISKSLFCQILEMAGENLLLGTPLQKIEELLGGANPLEELKKSRFPMTFFRDQNFKEKAQKWSWPKGIQAQTQRRGDSLGMEFRFFAKSPDELQKILKSFQTSSEQWKSDHDSN